MSHEDEATPQVAHTLNEKPLSERFQEYLAGPKDTLRAKLIEAVGQHEGWEEGAVALVDEAIIPVIAAFDEKAVEAAARALHEKYRKLRSVEQVPWEKLLPIARETAMDDARLMLEAYKAATGLEMP